MQSPLLNGKADCYSWADHPSPSFLGQNPASPCSGFPLGSGEPSRLWSHSLGCSLFIRPDSPVAMATLARQCLNLRQLGMSGLEIPFCLISHQRGCFQAEKFRRSVLSYVPGSCILVFPTKQDLTSSWHLRSGVCIWSLSPAVARSDCEQAFLLFVL